MRRIIESGNLNIMNFPTTYLCSKHKQINIFGAKTLIIKDLIYPLPIDPKVSWNSNI